MQLPRVVLVIHVLVDKKRRGRGHDGMKTGYLQKLVMVLKCNKEKRWRQFL